MVQRLDEDVKIVLKIKWTIVVEDEETEDLTCLRQEIVLKYNKGKGRPWKIRKERVSGKDMGDVFKKRGVLTKLSSSTLKLLF